MIREGLISFYKGIGKFRDMIVSMLTIPLFSSFRTAFRFRKLRVEQNRPCFVIGNGPSLKEVFNNESLLNEIVESDCIVTNRFANSEFFPILKPKYYLLLDPAFFSMQRMKDDESINTIYYNLQKVDWKMTLFLKNGEKVDNFIRMIDNPLIRVVHFNATKVVGYNWFQNFNYKANLGIPSSRNVIISALQLMINVGYKSIYLYGAEFSWTKTIDVDPRNNKVFLNNQHFYSDNEILYREKGWYKSYLIYVAEMLEGVYQVEKYANYCGVRIINRTKGSFIDAFEYENPDNL